MYHVVSYLQNSLRAIGRLSIFPIAHEISKYDGGGLWEGSDGLHDNYELVPNNIWLNALNHTI